MKPKPKHCVHCHQPILLVDGAWQHDHTGEAGQWQWCESRKDLSVKPAPRVDYSCAYCHRYYPYPQRVHSGYRECGWCWSWRKHQRAEADYWNTAINGLFVQEGLGSGPDANDMMLWDRWGIKDEVIQSLNVLEALRQRYEIALEAPDADTRDAVLGRDKTGENW